MSWALSPSLGISCCHFHLHFKSCFLCGHACLGVALMNEGKREKLNYWRPETLFQSFLEYCQASWLTPEPWSALNDILKQTLCKAEHTHHLHHSQNLAQADALLQVDKCESNAALLWVASSDWPIIQLLSWKLCMPVQILDGLQNLSIKESDQRHAWYMGARLPDLVCGQWRVYEFCMSPYSATSLEFDYAQLRLPIKHIQDDLMFSGF